MIEIIQMKKANFPAHKCFWKLALIYFNIKKL